MTNPARGEIAIELGGQAVPLRPSFTALVALEEELGPLFALVEKIADGRLALSEVAVIVDLLREPGRGPGWSRSEIGEALVAVGMVRIAPVLRTLVAQILQGR